MFTFQSQHGVGVPRQYSLHLIPEARSSAILFALLLDESLEVIFGPPVGCCLMKLFCLLGIWHICQGWWSWITGDSQQLIWSVWKHESSCKKQWSWDNSEERDSLFTELCRSQVVSSMKVYFHPLVKISVHFYVCCMFHITEVWFIWHHVGPRWDLTSIGRCFWIWWTVLALTIVCFGSIACCLESGEVVFET